MITEASGGLEHRNSAMLMTSRWAMGTRQAYVAWLSLVSHEFFHVWNVKRLRPGGARPVRLRDRELHAQPVGRPRASRRYYGDLLVRRAGLWSDAEYFGTLSADIRTPGDARRDGSCSRSRESSYDAWIKQYRPDENSANTSISYYTKGQVIAALLDARIRLASNGQRSLDDVMRLAYSRYAGAKGFTEAQFRGVITEVGGAELADVLARALDTTQPLDYQPLLDAYGLQFAAGRQPGDAGMARHHHQQRWRPAGGHAGPARHAGRRRRRQRGRRDPRHRRLPRAGGPVGPAARAVSADDAGDAAGCAARQLMQLEVTFGQEPGNAWRLAPRVAPTPAQLATRAAWLGASR